jgi:integrating conjugative element protein (TIGR03759 family)
MNKWRLKISGFLCLLLTGFLLYCLSIHAAEVENTQPISSGIQTTQVRVALSGAAQDWGLSEAEWQLYLKRMQGLNGLWYPQLSPAAVLGMNATTEQERQHFAEIIARQEHDKIARELIFNHAVYLALRKLYEDEPVIQPFDKSPFNPQHSRSSR